MGVTMAVATRLDARSQRNNSLTLKDEEGNTLAVIEVVSSKSEGVDKLRNEANLRIHTADDVRVVKSNGAVLRKK